MKGLIKLTHAANKQAALADFAIVAREAISRGLPVPALPLRAGHKTIDRLTEKMLKVLGKTWEDLRK